MKKLLNDTLKHNGKYSRKSITLLVAFSGAMFYEFALPFIAFFVGFEFNASQYVFDGLLLFSAGLLGLTVADKKIENNSK